jgi:DNA repair protein RadA/Sms
MAKQHSSFSCSNCGYRPPKWLGCCPECSQWGTIGQIEPSVSRPGQQKTSTHTHTVHTLQSVEKSTKERFVSSMQEWDRVLGGGLMQSSFLLLAGDPGIGKSTLLLQIAHDLGEHNKVLYISSEESLEQLKYRAERLGAVKNQFLCSDQAHLDSIIEMAVQQKPAILIIDSIQNCYSTDTQVLPGSIGQLRESGFKIMRLAKDEGIAVIITGHVTKEGNVAGPKMLEHMVDGVFYLHAEDRFQTRVLRAVKNRFGPVGELGFFTMEHDGLQQVVDINKTILKEASTSPGSCLTSTIEGSRPIMVELQALVVPTKYGMAQRVVSHIDAKQVILIAAIIEKYLHIKLSAHDIFFKVSGGFFIKDSGADLAIACALLSSYFQKELPAKSLLLGEISLTGLVKPINHAQLHIKEALKFGIEHLFLSSGQKIESSAKELHTCKSIYQLLELFDA